METKFEAVKCPICDAAGKWKNVDEYRYKPSGMCLCMSCGFITYPQVLVETEKLKEFYREEYRDVPNMGNIYSGQRKLHYHSAFLRPHFQAWKKAGKTAPVVFEIGAAFGMFLHWVRNNFPAADIYGSELTTSYRRNAWHEYGIWLGEDFDASRKYDLIASYKVAEHQPRIDVELRRYVETLTDDGLFYISVPTWLKVLGNFGAAGFSLEYYYHKNHINVWTPTLFETLLAKSGLEIVGQNHSYYDDTYICRRNDARISAPRTYEDPQAVLEKLARIKTAAQAFDESRFDDAVAAWPNFPEAHLARYESTRAKNHQQGFDAINETFVKPALAACPENAQARLFAADLHMRYNRFAEAMTFLEEAVELRPNDPSALMNLSQCFRQLANISQNAEEKVKLYSQARECARLVKATSLQSQADASNWVFNDNARIPIPEVRPARTSVIRTDADSVEDTDDGGRPALTTRPPRRNLKA